jgi:hypothetical protein
MAVHWCATNVEGGWMYCMDSTRRGSYEHERFDFLSLALALEQFARSEGGVLVRDAALTFSRKRSMAHQDPV